MKNILSPIFIALTLMISSPVLAEKSVAEFMQQIEDNNKAAALNSDSKTKTCERKLQHIAQSLNAIEKLDYTCLHTEIWNSLENLPSPYHLLPPFMTLIELCTGKLAVFIPEKDVHSIFEAITYELDTCLVNAY